MKNISVTISYDEEKLAALKLYLSQKNKKVEDELIASLEALYTKTVPANVRAFIDLRAGVPVPDAKKRKPKPTAPGISEVPPTEGDAS